MSGHSHWSSIKRQKETTDKKRGKIFSKISRQISIAAKEGGGTPETNSSLRISIEKAKEFNMPKDNIDKAIKRGTGELEGAKLDSFIFEAYGPERIAIIIEGITDNKNRTISEIKQILNQNNGKLAEEGSVKWLFEKKGSIIVNLEDQEKQFQNKEQLDLEAIEAGAEDITWQKKNILEIHTKPENLESTKNNLKEKEVEIESSSVNWIPKEEIEAGEKTIQRCQKIFEALDENDAVQEIYSNLKTSS
jgi:YebC/PmpR family DNA-binding regulatory protein